MRKRTKRLVNTILLAIFLVLLRIYYIHITSSETTMRNERDLSPVTLNADCSQEAKNVRNPTSRRREDLLKELLAETVIWPRSDENETNDRILNQIRFAEEYARLGGNTATSMKIILRVGVFGFQDWIEGQQRFVEDSCPIYNCYLTSDVERYARTADALLIGQFYNSTLRRYMPKPPHQIWILRHHESAIHSRVEPDLLRDLLNWTATYRRDSTLAKPYFKFAATRPTVNVGAPPVNYAEGLFSRRWSTMQTLC